MKNISDELYRENQNTHFMLKILLFMGYCGGKKKTGRAGQATDDNIIRLMSIACWINKATHTHSEYVICIAFLLQQ
jgi:hypothetical protein